MILGFVGTGTITEAMVRGVKSSSLADWPVILSPRNAQVAARLAALPGVSVASSNQEVCAPADLVILAVRPQIAKEVLTGLSIDVPVISLIAGLDHGRIEDWTGSPQVCRAVPLPFVAEGRDATPVFPPDPVAVALFDALGLAVPVATKAEFDLLAALSALMGSFFGLAETASGWAVTQGLPEAQTRAYLGRLFANLGQVMRDDPASLTQLRHDHSTKGGLNEQIWRDFAAKGGAEALTQALGAALTRIRG